MGRMLRRLMLLGLLVAAAMTALRRLGVLGGSECGPACDCSMGADSCDCGHATCLAPAEA